MNELRDHLGRNGQGQRTQRVAARLVVSLSACICLVLVLGLPIQAGAGTTGSPNVERVKAATSPTGVNALVRAGRRKQSDKFSNIWLTTQHGKRVRFYDDLVKNKVVLINLMYTTCTNVCPMNTVQLTKLHDLLKRWMGREITLLSISIDPEVDSAGALKQYWQAFGAKPGWLFLTGKFNEIEKLRRDLGVYDLDPVIDADKSQHSGILTIGNDRSDRWLALPIMMHLRQLATTILRNTHDKQWRNR